MHKPIKKALTLLLMLCTILSFAPAVFGYDFDPQYSYDDFPFGPNWRAAGIAASGYAYQVVYHNTVTGEWQYHGYYGQYGYKEKPEDDTAGYWTPNSVSGTGNNIYYEHKDAPGDYWRYVPEIGTFTYYAYPSTSGTIVITGSKCGTCGAQGTGGTIQPNGDCVITQNNVAFGNYNVDPPGVPTGHSWTPGSQSVTISAASPNGTATFSMVHAPPTPVTITVEVEPCTICGQSGTPTGGGTYSSAGLHTAGATGYGDIHTAASTPLFIHAQAF
jgi:hypothetical protein